MNNNEKGELSESKIISCLLEHGYSVSIPFGNNQPYDLIMDDGRDLKKIQVKTGRLRNGVILANACKTEKNWKDKKSSSVKYSKSDFDLLAIYCPDTKSTFLIPFEDISSSKMSLRVEPTKNGQLYDIKWAKDYKI